MRIFIIAFSLLTVLLPRTAHAYTEDQIKAYCEDPKRAVSDGERQPNGKKADAMVLELKPGSYETENGAHIDVFEKNYYNFTLAPKVFQRYGTEGEDLMTSADDKSVGGCSLAQLSELLIRNNLNIADFKPAKKKAF